MKKTAYLPLDPPRPPWTGKPNKPLRKRERGGWVGLVENIYSQQRKVVLHSVDVCDIKNYLEIFYLKI